MARGETGALSTLPDWANLRGSMSLLTWSLRPVFHCFLYFLRIAFLDSRVFVMGREVAIVTIEDYRIGFRKWLEILQRNYSFQMCLITRLACTVVSSLMRLVQWFWRYLSLQKHGYPSLPTPFIVSMMTALFSGFEQVEMNSSVFSITRFLSFRIVNCLWGLWTVDLAQRRLKRSIIFSIEKIKNWSEIWTRNPWVAKYKVPWPLG